ncbi:MAG TPA: tripartite tricarboxylate transporter TctB family protein [Solirubrobacteraceae bacterium]|nr:tripartite tricarboxylate transporter TctB family protein [Solirubrobacteraceae bacterium]
MRTLDGRVVWLAAIATVAAGYTWMAFGMEWETEAGRIGPGFFPRIIGGLTVVLCLVAIARCLRERRPAEAGHGRLVAYAAVGMLGYLLAFEYAGAAIASVAFMLFLLSATNRGRTVANVTLAVLLPAALYLLFEYGLGAGLPPGPLPVV